MTIYRDNLKPIHGLVRADSVHRDLYVDSAPFDVEMERLWRNAWIYVGLDSQVPAVGDFYSTLIGKDPMILVRAAGERVQARFMYMFFAMIGLGTNVTAFLSNPLVYSSTSHIIEHRNRSYARALQAVAI